MAILSKQAIITQIDSLIRKYSNVSNESTHELRTALVAEATSAIHSMISNFSSVGSKHLFNADQAIKQYGQSNSYCVDILSGILRALKADYESGNLLSIQELIHGDVFSDFLEMAEHLNSEGYKDPAAVLAGGVLEEHLRKLCIKTNVSAVKADGSPKKADAMNNDLAAANVITKLDQKSVTAWLGLRNDAAHGHYTKYIKEQVSLLISGVRDFLTRNPA